MADSFDTSLPPKPSRHEKTKGSSGGRLLLTRAHITQVQSLLQRTLYVETVAAHMGVHRQTFWQWLREGSRESLRREQGMGSDADYDLHVDLYYEVKKCLAKCEGDYLANIQNAGIEQWTANAWLLERRFPSRWSTNRAELNQIQKRLNQIEKDNAKSEQAAGKQGTQTPAITQANGEPQPHIIEPSPGS